MPAETVGEVAHLETADHPPRTDSPEYIATRKWLMSSTFGGCFVCGGPGDLSHPEVANSHGLEDHHSNGLHYKGVLFGLGLIPMEWSLGWAADPAVVTRFVALTNTILTELGEPAYDLPITDTAGVMAWTDSRMNANVILCRAHHIGTQTQHTPDVNGHEAVGIHEIPLPVWAGQVTCQWERFDMWCGSTGTVAAAPHTDDAGQPMPGHVRVLHAHPSTGLTRGQVLPPHHPHARLAHAGAHVHKESA